MKTLCALLALLALHPGVVGAQDARLAAAPGPVRRSPEELEKLLAPIALYPDALIAMILPAATAPADVVLAARQLRDQPGDRSQIEHRAWDESVKSLTNYPAVVAWMDENLAWTKQVGEAFIDQPAEVMQAMQRLRAQARAAGTLVDTPQQQVIAEADVIRIVPAQPDVIYVPYYQPEVVFVSQPYHGYSYPRPFFSFGAGVAVGSWLAFECDWRRHTIWVGNRHRPWTGHNWTRPLVTAPPIGAAYARTPDVRSWRPSPQVVRANFHPAPRPKPTVVQPQPFARIEHSAGLPVRPVHLSPPAPRHGEPSPNAVTRQPRPESTRPRISTPTVVAPPLPNLPALAPTVPPSTRPAAPVRSHEYRERGQPGRNTPPTVVQAPAPVASPTPPPSTRSHRSPDHSRPAHAPVGIPAQPAAAAPGRGPASPQDYRGHSRSAPAIAPTPQPSAPATTTTAPANPPPQRGDRSGERRDGRPDDPQR
ncbi:MAG: DUF3300 domain-containing protein [Opitutaceae bacterium]|nr:DUF3300 domain-containing protein [Opitutaceae bacterium]